MRKEKYNKDNDTRKKAAQEEKIRVYATEQGALYIKVEELFALKKVQTIVEKALNVKVVGYKKSS